MAVRGPSFRRVGEILLQLGQGPEREVAVAGRRRRVMGLTALVPKRITKQLDKRGQQSCGSTLRIAVSGVRFNLSRAFGRKSLAVFTRIYHQVIRAARHGGRDQED